MESIAHPNQRIVMPSEIEKVVSPQQLQENEAALLADTPEVGPEELEAAKQQLMSLFLIHGTKVGSGFRRGILPNSLSADIQGVEGNTFPFDKSLGLDECTFFSWPLPANKGDYKGANRILVSPELLLDERCFVTPRDIYECAAVDEDEHGNKLPDEAYSDSEWLKLEAAYEEVYMGAYADLQSADNNPFDYDGVHISSDDLELAKQRAQQQLHNNYFTKIVSGKVWLEYVARNLASGGPDAIPLGEIKFTGTVPPSKIEAIVGPEEFEQVYLPHVSETLLQAF